MERHDAEMGNILANSKHQAVNNYKKLIAAAAAVAKDEFFFQLDRSTLNRPNLLQNE